MRNKYNEPRSGCSILIGCAFLFLISIIILIVITATALSDYMPEISAQKFSTQEEYSAYVISLANVINTRLGMLNANFYQVLTNAAQIIVLFIVFRMLYKRPISQMGLSVRNWVRFLILGCMTGLLAISLYALIASLTGIASFSGFDLNKLMTFNMLTSFIYFISVGFIEEIMFRGFLMTVLKTTRNKWVIVFLPAVIFGFMHMLNPNVTALSVINIILIGLAFAYMFMKTGSLWMPIGYHIMWNFFQGNIYGIEVSGMEQTSLLKYMAAGPDILTGGEFGAEGGLICTAITLAVLASIHFAVNVKEPAWSLDSGLPFNSK